MPSPPHQRFDQVSLVRMVADYVRRNARSYGASAILLTGVALISAWVPRKIGQTVDALVAAPAGGVALLWPVGMLLGAGLAIYLMRVAWRIMLYGTAYRLGVELRTSLFNRLTGHGPRFFQQRRTGDLMALATNDIDAVEMAAGEAFLAGFDGTLTLVVVLAMMSLGLDWRLTLIALIPFPLMALSFWWISRKVHQASRQSLDTFARLNEHTQETLAGVRTVRAIGLQRQSHEEFTRLAGKAADAGLTESTWEATYDPAIGMSMGLAMLLVLGVGGKFLLDGELTIGQLTAFTMYMGQLIWPMFAMGWVLSLIERGRAAWERLLPVLSGSPDIEDHGDIASVPVSALRFDRASLQYPGQSRPALADISLTLEPGQRLGVVGPTGSGKSSLIALLLRHYPCSDSAVQWGGQPLASYRLDALRAAIAWVPQEAFLFSATIARNIALARPEASAAQIEQAAKLADLHEDILAFPSGYETLVGERGVTLSGGQRQRVAIARALLTDAPLLILDDALSAVDTGTETRILNHLRALRKQRAEHDQRSAIIISHRLSAVVETDHIVVLSQGEVIAQGTHMELLQQNGWYAEQWRYQQLEASLDAI